MKRETFIAVSNHVTEKLRSKKDISNEKTAQLAEEIVELIVKKEELKYIEIYAALEIAYLTIDEQSQFTSLRPISDT